MATSCDKAKQYLVTVEDMNFTLNETENETGLELKAEVDSKNDGVKNMLADLSVASSTSAAGAREKTPAELEDIAQKKAAESNSVKRKRRRKQQSSSRTCQSV